jgi:hypothetical protein
VHAQGVVPEGHRLVRKNMDTATVVDTTVE